MFAALLPVLSGVVGKVVGNLFPDPEQADKRERTKQEFVTALIDQAQSIELAAADIVKAEAQSGNWLASSWRPLTMLVFVGLIVARWFGWAAPNLSEAEYLKLWSIVELGLGGYVIGRTAEKLVPNIADAIKATGKR
jgi:hypothetical protein